MKRFILLLSISSIFVCLIFASTKKAQVATTGNWLNGIGAEETPTDSASYNSNIRCLVDNVKSQYVNNHNFINNLFHFTDVTTLTEGKTYTNQCLFTTPEGLFSTSNLWSPTNDKAKMLPIVAFNYTVLPLPKKGFIVRDGSYPGGFYYSVNKGSLKDAGVLSAKYYGSGSSQKTELAWKVPTSNLQEFYTYSDHSLVKFDEIAVSSNGEYAAASINQRGIVKINLTTGALTPISTEKFNNGFGSYLSISNDGRFVMTKKAGVGKLFAYDTQACISTYPAGSWPKSGVFSGAGCVSKDLYPELKLLYPTITEVTGFSFLSNSVEVEILMHRIVSGVAQPQLLRLKPSSYEANAHGYLALGDSFASGEGDTDGQSWYEQGTDEQGNEDTFQGRNLCHLSRRSYPYLMAIDLGLLVTNTSSPESAGSFHSVACSGAKMHNISGILGEKQDEGNATDFAVTDNQYRYDDGFSLEVWQSGYAAQLTYTKQRIQGNIVKPAFNPEIITMSIGGNDAGFGQKLLACLLPGTCEFASNQTKRVAVAKELAGERENLVKAYKKVKVEAPDARVYIIGYPKFVQASPESCASNVHLDNDEATFVNYATAYYNDIIESAAAIAGVVYVDVEDALVNVNLCSGAPPERMAVNGLTAGNDIALSPVNDGLFRFGLCIYKKCLGSETYHPNQNGHKLYKESIMAQTADLTTQNPSPIETDVPIPNDYFGLEARVFVENLNGTTYSPQNYAKMQEMVTGALGFRQPTLTLNGMMPDSTVRFEIQSEPVLLGEAVVSGDGSVQFTAQLPIDLPTGYHELHVYGFDVYGNPVEYYEPIMVGANELDFDGDTVPNSLDSCPSVPDSAIDADDDGTDDVCDIVVVLAEEELPLEESPETLPEEPETEAPAEEEGIKGIPSRETVAGDEELPTLSGAVLGVSTAASSTQSVATLSNTGTSIFGALIISSVILLGVKFAGKHSKLKTYRLKK